MTEVLSVKVTPGEMAPAVTAARKMAPAEMPAKMSAVMAVVSEVAKMSTEVTEMPEVTATEAPEMSKAVKAAKAVEAMKAPAKAMKTTSVKTAKPTSVKTAPAAVKTTAGPPKGRSFTHNPRRDAWRKGGFEHKSESDRHCDDFRPFASHHAVLPRPPSRTMIRLEARRNPLARHPFRRLADYLARRQTWSIRTQGNFGSLKARGST
ncbi:MAG: hypothetical protein WB816_15145 [Methylocystis sp.]